MSRVPSYFRDVPKLPKEVSQDGVKWLMVTSKIILDSCCVWPEKQNNFSRLIHVWYILSYIVSNFGQLYCITDKNSDPATIAYAISLFMVTTETFTRRILCYIYREKLKAVLHKVYYDFWPSRCFGEEKHKELKKGSWYVCIFTCVYTFSAFLCGMQWMIVPFVQNNLPLQTTYPFQWRETPTYEILYVWQALITLDIIFTTCGVDLFFVSLVSNCVAQFKLLKVYLKAKFKEVNEEKRKDPMEVIVSCIRHHNKLIEVCKQIDKTFSQFILVQYLISMGTVCVSAFIAVVMPSAFGVAFTYFVGHMSELLIYCYIGNEIMLESEDFRNTVYECGWHLYNTRIDLQKSLVIIMARCLKPVRMTAGGFGFLSLTSFMKLVQFSFSVFTMLNSMMKDEQN